jgi:hypothetical protein
MPGSGVQVGYMNAHHQRVVARARRRDDPANCFVVWCSQCRHYYVADDSEKSGGDVPTTTTGAPAISADSHDVEWISGLSVQSANRCPLM